MIDTLFDSIISPSWPTWSFWEPNHLFLDKTKKYFICNYSGSKLSLYFSLWPFGPDFKTVGAHHSNAGPFTLAGKINTPKFS